MLNFNSTGQPLTRPGSPIAMNRPCPMPFAGLRSCTQVGWISRRRWSNYEQHLCLPRSTLPSKSPLTTHLSLNRKSQGATSYQFMHTRSHRPIHVNMLNFNSTGQPLTRPGSPIAKNRPCPMPFAGLRSCMQVGRISRRRWSNYEQHLCLPTRRRCGTIASSQHRAATT